MLSEVETLKALRGIRQDLCAQEAAQRHFAQWDHRRRFLMRAYEVSVRFEKDDDLHTRQPWELTLAIRDAQVARLRGQR